MKKLSAILLLFMLNGLTSLLLLNMHADFALASTSFNPDPLDKPGMYWDFDKGDHYGWLVKEYNNDTLLNEYTDIFNVSAMVHKKVAGNWYYYVELSEIIYNATKKGISPIPASKMKYAPVYNASLINYTLGQSAMKPAYILTEDEKDKPFLNLFMPRNASVGNPLDLYWSTNALNDTFYGMFLDMPVMFEIDLINNKTMIKEQNGPYYVRLKYDKHGVLETGQIMIDVTDIPAPFDGNYTVNYTRVYDFNPINELNWAVSKDQNLYTYWSMGKTDDVVHPSILTSRFKFVRYFNSTKYDDDRRQYMTFQNVTVNRTFWNTGAEIWFYTQVNQCMGKANEIDFLLNPPYVIPDWVTQDDLVNYMERQRQHSKLYDKVTPYADFGVHFENSTTKEFGIYSYFPNGLMQYLYVSNDSIWYSGGKEEYACHYHKNMTIIDDVSETNFWVYDFKDDFNISVDVEVNQKTQLFYAGIPQNPTNISVGSYDKVIYLDLMVNKTTNVDFPINLSVEYDPTKTGDYSLWSFNQSKDVWDWEQLNLDDDYKGKLNATLQHLSIFAIAINYKDKPGSFIAHSHQADNPDRDGNFNINWTSSSNAVKYTIYHSTRQITTYNNTVKILAENVVANSIKVEDWTDGSYYFAILAINTYGQILSNNVRINISLALLTAFILTTDAKDPDTDGIFNLTWTSSTWASEYRIYYSTRYITKINSTVSLLISGLSNNSIHALNWQNGTYYFIVIAFNSLGNKSSNCINITVSLLPGRKDEPSGFDIIGFLLTPLGIGIVGGSAAAIIGVAYIIRRRRTV